MKRKIGGCNIVIFKCCLNLFDFRPSPCKEVRNVTQHLPASAASFQDFQESVSDAWDIGDDEFCNISGKVVLNFEG